MKIVRSLFFLCSGIFSIFNCKRSNRWCETVFQTVSAEKIENWNNQQPRFQEPKRKQLYRWNQRNRPFYWKWEQATFKPAELFNKCRTKSVRSGWAAEFLGVSSINGFKSNTSRWLFERPGTISKNHHKIYLSKTCQLLTLAEYESHNMTHIFIGFIPTSKSSIISVIKGTHSVQVFCMEIKNSNIKELKNDYGAKNDDLEINPVLVRWRSH